MSGKNKLAKFGWIVGVFIPTFLTIVGVIFYLRLGFIVGAAGILGAIVIILISESIVLVTAYAISSISRREVSHGGVFSLIEKMLGLPIAGAVGILLFIAMVFSVAFYIFGFAEAWQFMFPDHSLLLTSLIVYLAIFALVFVNIKVATKAQIVVFGLIVLSFFAIFGAGFNSANLTPYITNFSTEPFWKLFAIFFPAVTGVMAGVGLSGQLKDPRKDITKGIFWAISVTAIFYIGAVFWLGFNSSADNLIQDKLVMLNLAKIPLVVLVGILAATFSSGLVTFVATTRLLQAISYHHLFPFSGVMLKRRSGEPRNAALFIGLVVLFILFLSNLDSIASILTIVFLLTYGVVNYATLKIPARKLYSKILALYGVGTAAIVIILINVGWGLLSLALTLVLYQWLKRIVKKQ
jgi:solute carrier family 12 (sodium/potassium/chloride transporter), member 2